MYVRKREDFEKGRRKNGFERNRECKDM